MPEFSQDALFLGIDLSTQSCKAVAVNGKIEVKYSARVGFDQDPVGNFTRKKGSDSEGFVHGH